MSRLLPLLLLSTGGCNIHLWSSPNTDQSVVTSGGTVATGNGDCMDSFFSTTWPAKNFPQYFNSGVYDDRISFWNQNLACQGPDSSISVRDWPEEVFVNATALRNDLIWYNPSGTLFTPSEFSIEVASEGAASTWNNVPGVQSDVVITIDNSSVKDGGDGRSILTSRTRLLGIGTFGLATMSWDANNVSTDIEIFKGNSRTVQGFWGLFNTVPHNWTLHEQDLSGLSVAPFNQVLEHELGHLQGRDHSEIITSLMNRAQTVQVGNTEEMFMTAVDEDAHQAMYVP